MRKKKRIRWFRPLVCLLAACFSILIFIVGTSTRYSRPFIRSLTVLSDENSRENENSETIYTSIQAPFNSSYEVSINPAYHVTSLMEEYYWGSGTQNGTVNAKRVVSFDFSKEQTLLSLDYYEYYLYTKKEQLYVMAQIDYMPAIQQYTDYPVENDTIICLSVTQN